MPPLKSLHPLKHNRRDLLLGVSKKNSHSNESTVQSQSLKGGKWKRGKGEKGKSEKVKRGKVMRDASTEL